MPRAGYNSQKPMRPELNRSGPFYSGLVFASAFWDEGAGSGAPFENGHESVGHVNGATRHQGTWNVQPKANGVNWESYGYGLSFDEGPSPPDKRLTWVDPGGICNPLFGVTIAAALRKEGATAVGADNFVAGKRDGTTGAFPGYSLHTKNFVSPVSPGPGWAFEVCSAAGVQQQGQAMSQGVNEDTVIVGVYDRVNVTLWQDGAIAQDIPGPNATNPQAAAFAVGANANPISAFNVATGGLQIDDALMMLAIWNRALTPQEIGALFADPLILWKQPHREFFLGIGPGLAGAIDACCCP